MSSNKELINQFGKNISKNISLSNYSWFNLGGPAEYLFKPKNKDQLIKFLKVNKKNRFNITVLGAGSNTLIRDKGIKGVVIKLGSSFSYINQINQDILEVGASTLDRKVSNYAKDCGLGNMEFLSCIPGSIGGAVIMNSGCYGNEISKILESINIIDINNCEEKKLNREEIDFFYRGTNLSKDLIITSVRLRGIAMPKNKIEKIQNELLKKKKLAQPSQVKTCGSTFKNFNNEKKAWQLIKESGCDGLKEGGASISKTHSNFFINDGNAKSSDIEKLIEKVRQIVSKKFGVKLELEIKIIGD